MGIPNFRESIYEIAFVLFNLNTIKDFIINFIHKHIHFFRRVHKHIHKFDYNVHFDLLYFLQFFYLEKSLPLRVLKLKTLVFIFS